MKAETSTHELDDTPPPDWESFLHQLETRASLGVEKVQEDRSSRTYAIGKSVGNLTLAQQPNEALILVTIQARGWRTDRGHPRARLADVRPRYR